MFIYFNLFNNYIIVYHAWLDEWPGLEDIPSLYDSYCMIQILFGCFL